MTMQKARGFYLTAGVAAIVFICLIVADIAASMAAAQSPTPGSLSSRDVLNLFQTNPLRGFQYLGLLNVIEQMLMLTIVFAFFLSHMDVYRNACIATLVLFSIELVICIGNNVSLPLYALGRKYGSAGIVDRAVIVAAGDSFLARGEDFTLGSLPGFFLSEVSLFLMLLVMLKARVFGRVSAIAGLAGALLLAVFTFGATLNPALYTALMTASMVGGLLMPAWYVLLAIRFFRMAGRAA
jgi:hypothetical protein